MLVINNLTVIIPTFNRPEYLDRAIKYWKNLGIKTVIVDGGNGYHKDKELNNNIQYCYFPNTTTYERFSLLKEKVSTDYVAIIGDDEFLLPQALMKCVDFLDQNPNFVSCFGRTIGFKYFNKKIIGRFRYPDIQNVECDSDDKLKRIKSLLSNYKGVISHYGVCRKKNWFKTVEIVKENSIGNKIYGLNEIMFEVSMIYQGKFKIINDLIWLRSEENDMISIPDNNFIRFWEKSFFSKEKENFLKQFSKKLCENDNNFLKFESFLKTCLNNYLVKEKEIHKNQSKKNLLKKIIKLINKKLFYKLRDIYQKNYLYKKFSTLEHCTSLLRSKGVEVMKEDVDRVTEMLKNFYQNTK